jgi:hypothetical protein
LRLSIERESLSRSPWGPSTLVVVIRSRQMRFPVHRRTLLFLPAVLAAIALPVAPALAGEDGDSNGSSGPANLRASQGCVAGHWATAAVTGAGIAKVAFYLDGKLVKTATQPNSKGAFATWMKCARLRVGAHRGRAVVSFAQGSSPASQTLRFQVTRSRAGSPRFTG